MCHFAQRFAEDKQKLRSFEEFRIVLPYFHITQSLCAPPDFGFSRWSDERTKEGDGWWICLPWSKGSEGQNKNFKKPPCLWTFKWNNIWKNLIECIMEFECQVLFAVWMWLSLRRNSTRHVESKGNGNASKNPESEICIHSSQVLVTTSRDPSSRLSQFLKELRMLYFSQLLQDSSAQIASIMINWIHVNEVSWCPKDESRCLCCEGL